MYDVPFDCITDYVQDMSFSSTVPFGVKKFHRKYILYFNAQYLRNFITNHGNIENFYIIRLSFALFIFLYLVLNGDSVLAKNHRVYYNLYTYELKSNQS